MKQIKVHHDIYIAGKIEETRGDKKKRKELIKLSYRDGDESDKLFAVNKKGTKLSQLTLKTWTKEKTTMPLDIHFEARNFFKQVFVHHQFIQIAVLSHFFNLYFIFKY